MNAVEIEEALSELAKQPFDAEEFPFDFLKAFGNKDTTIKMLRSSKSSSNISDIPGGVLQRNNIHISVCPEGDADNYLSKLKESASSAKGKVKIILATDGIDFVAENIVSGETVASEFKNFPHHFGFFLTLAGISTTKEIRNNPVDIQATGRLNRLYVELLKENQEWDTAERRHDLNQFMSRLIFCFFAEDTGIFPSKDLFTNTIDQMSDNNSGNVDFVISKIFHAMDVKYEDRVKEALPNWTHDFPYVNGGLFSGNRDVPKFSRIARSYLIHAGNLNWKTINPDIFGSMIQAISDDEERGLVGMHYTSVPNILKLLNPLFLDDLNQALQEAGDNQRKLINLKKRISRIRIFDPACGSGNFLVIAYKEMRKIESVINDLRGESHLRSEIPLSNFRGIELREFATEIARLALIIAEYQCDELYRGQKDALADFLPLDSENWIVHGNALRTDWLSVCPPTKQVAEDFSNDLFQEPKSQPFIDFRNEGGETYICGNPPFKGNADMDKSQKLDMKDCLSSFFPNWRSLDYICAWFYLAHIYCHKSNSSYAFVSTNSICQGQNIDNFWAEIRRLDVPINFAVLSFQWNNLASNNAGVTVVIIGCAKSNTKQNCYLYDSGLKREVNQINAYLIAGPNVYVKRASETISPISEMIKGNYYGLSEGLLMEKDGLKEAVDNGVSLNNIKIFKGSSELIKGMHRYCLWIPDEKALLKYSDNNFVQERIKSVYNARINSPDQMAKKMADTPYRFREMRECNTHTIAIPVVSSENREYLPVFLEENGTVFSHAVFALYDAPLWNFALIASRVHIVWISTVCGRLRSDFRYSNTIGWNNFPVPNLTEKNKIDLIRCTEDILIAREKHFPASVAELYKPDNMPENLLQAHKKNDEIIERIYIGRKFKNDTERLEKLFELYVKLTSTPSNSVTKGNLS
ncbi:lactate dehydrogenase [Methylophilales bacterium MBRSG12]|uniref:site-specific DNA-methyltransferase (adenine-specific) n=1 Tax=Methylophilales bacterium MBRS-H7 TaxID=1623450 RepID=A0A0H4JBV5_9PROT|nr:lactate dehydrogenase [Methylophilales bacterium MBRSF5]AKO65972.1 lactate dehydrogenase [Methylophilales bacterium MBRS-H7]AKO67292.1 lactate dehydrogenase [Methylophilales bacterium MBRSG12]